MYTVIVPIYNEACNIKKFLLELKKYTKSILVVDDGSTDGSAEIARSLEVRVLQHSHNIGKGAAVLTGLRNARTEFVILIDGDGQFSPSEISLFSKRINECDLILGNRFHKDLEMPLHRFLANKLLKLSLPAYISVEDPLVGFRALRRSKFLDMKEKGFEQDIEMIISAIRKDLKVCEVPVSVTYKVRKSNSIKHTTGKMTTFAKLLLYALKQRS
jgi:glycosyltransferase involved in cell wall biosynthesis